MRASRLLFPIAVLLALVACRRSPRARTLEGRTLEPLREAPVVALLFVSTDCPVSNRYAPELARLRTRWRQRGVPVHLVYPSGLATAITARAHLREYSLGEDALLDDDRELALAACADVTPEAAVFARGQRVYHGRIDNRFAAFGRMRPEATTHELEDALEAAVRGAPVRVPHALAVGCALPQR